MRTVKYRVRRTFAGRAADHEGTLADLVLDIPHLIDHTGLIPPLTVLNQVLQGGGQRIPIAPGTTWRPLVISRAEYGELVDALLTLDMDVAREQHPLIPFERAVLDDEFAACADYREWLARKYRKYGKDGTRGG